MVRAGMGRDSARKGAEAAAAAEKPVPSDPEAEAALLGALLIDPEATGRVAALLKPADFYREKNGWIYEACLALSARGQHVDQVTVMRELHDRERLADAGGVAYITELVAMTPTSVHAADYAEIVAECAVKRRLIDAAGDLARRAYDGAASAEAIGATIERLAALRRPSTLPPPLSFADVGDVIKRVTFVWQGWLAGGILHLVAAEPGQGKSLLALYIAGCLIRGDPWPDGTPFTGECGEVLWCECESSHGLNHARIERLGLPPEALITPLADALGDVRLDDPAQRARIAAYARRPTVRLVIIDSFSGATRRNENDSIAADNAFWLAALARDTGLPVLAVHHLRKASLNDKPGIVTLDRLRGHSAIVQAARIIWALDVPNPARKGDRRVSVIKSNIAGMPAPVGMGIDAGGPYFSSAPELPRQETVTEKASDLLLAVLAGGARTAEEVREEFLGAGISPRSMHRAKDQLRIVSVKRGDRWLWSLPVDDPEGGI